MTKVSLKPLSAVEPRRLLTAADVTRLSGVSYGYVRRLAAAGEIPVFATFHECAPLFEPSVIALVATKRAGWKDRTRAPSAV